MKLGDFNSQVNTLRLQHILQSGDFITTRYEPPCHIYLYALGSFYVEIWHVATFDSQPWCWGFSTLDKLDAYLTTLVLPPIRPAV